MKLFYRVTSLLVIPILLSGLIWQVVSSTDFGPDEWRTKVDPELLAAIDRQSLSSGRAKIDEDVFEFIVRLDVQADLTAAAQFRHKEEKGRYVYEQLKAVADEEQAALLLALPANIEVTPLKQYWIVNSIRFRGSAAAVRTIAQRTDVAHIHTNQALRRELPAPEVGRVAATPAQGLTWGIDLIDAELVWAQGITGTGVVIAGQDTGYAWEHEALRDQYRGWDGVTVDHNYSWFDAINEDFDGDGNPCGLESEVPCDDHSHGTHTMGTMIGDAPGRQIGVAPGAEWIGCRNMEEGVGTPSTYIDCYQWFLAPTDLNGENPRPEMAPHVINNSWGCPTSEGCNLSNFEQMEMVIGHLRAAGIMTVVSAGNSGSRCGSVNTPSAIYDAAYSVGATNQDDQIAPFSSRGPVTVDGSNRLKPDIAAPGVSVLSAALNNGYSSLSGTSMAAPHVAGLVALLISADPTLAGDIDRIEAVINSSAVQLTTESECGGDTIESVPNHTFGHGRIDALAAVNALFAVGGANFEIEKEVDPEEIFLETIHSDSFLLTTTITLTNTHPITPLLNLVITDTLPANALLLTSTVPVQADGLTQVWALPQLSPRSAVAFNFLYSMTLETNQPMTITHPATLASADQFDPVPSGTPQTLITRLPLQLQLPLFFSDFIRADTPAD